MKQNQKPSTKTKKVIDRGKRSKTWNKVKPVEIINKNQKSFLEISPVQNEVLRSHKPQHSTYGKQNPFGLKKDNPSREIARIIEQSKFISH